MKIRRWQFIIAVSVFLLVAALLLRALNVLSQDIYLWPGFLSVILMVAIISYFVPFPEDTENR